uniref:Uncharacterized protein n=1 Tax=viral metagenome TaxID=1070528 RepID=A0A6C0H3X2_9ZZZZ
MSKYLDPPNSEEIIKQISDLQTIGDVKSFSKKVFPGWYVTSSTDYCKDYPHLSMNWKKFCDLVSVDRTLILLVDDVSFDDSHTVIRAFAECFTRAGFSVRSVDEYITCSVCKNIIPTKYMWGVFKEKGAKVPLVWSEKCTECS